MNGALMLQILWVASLSSEEHSIWISDWSWGKRRHNMNPACTLTFLGWEKKVWVPSLRGWRRSGWRRWRCGWQLRMRSLPGSPVGRTPPSSFARTPRQTAASQAPPGGCRWSWQPVGLTCRTAYRWSKEIITSLLIIYTDRREGLV